MGAKPLGASLAGGENRVAAELRAKTAFFPGIKYFNSDCGKSKHGLGSAIHGGIP
jgi:hypothetical protein